MKTKHNVFVPVGSQQEAERMEKVLRAMGEEIREDYYTNTFLDKPELDYRDTGWILGVSRGHKTQITFGELIDILSKPEKIAVKVENEREFKVLMKYYDGLGWTWNGGSSPLDSTTLSYPNHIWHEDAFVYDEIPDRKIIPFQDFAKEHNIKVPLLISEDRVELFEQDEYYRVCDIGSKGNNWTLIIIGGSIDNSGNLRKDYRPMKNDRIFSTKESALKWIEEQKPKVVEVRLSCPKHLAIISEQDVKIRIGTLESNKTYLLQHSDIQAIAKAMEELKC